MSNFIYIQVKFKYNFEWLDKVDAVSFSARPCFSYIIFMEYFFFFCIRKRAESRVSDVRIKSDPPSIQFDN